MLGSIRQCFLESEKEKYNPSYRIMCEVCVAVITIKPRAKRKDIREETCRANMVQSVLKHKFPSQMNVLLSSRADFTLIRHFKHSFFFFAKVMAKRPVKQTDRHDCRLALLCSLAAAVVR